jgi:hypothetical protein
MNESSVLTDSLGGSPAGNNFITFRLVLRTLGLVFAYYVAYFFYRLYTVRSLVKRQAREYGLVSLMMNTTPVRLTYSCLNRTFYHTPGSWGT